MGRTLGLAGLALVVAGCAAPAAPYYYCVEIKLNLPKGRQVDALECWPRERRVPWDPQAPSGTDLFSAGPLDATPGG